MSRSRETSQAEPRLFDDPPDVITAIVPHIDDPNLRTIYVNDRPLSTLRAADVEELEVEVGQSWTHEIREKVDSLEDAAKARQWALQLLGRRSYSSHQVRQKLTERFGPDAASRIVTELVNDGWLDDRAFAMQLIKSILRRGPAGRPLLESRLSQTGVDSEIVASALDRAVDAQDMVDLAVRYIMTHMHRAPDEGNAAHRRRIAQRLVRRGLDEDLVSRVLIAVGFSSTVDDLEHQA